MNSTEEIRASLFKIISILPYEQLHTLYIFARRLAFELNKGKQIQ